MFGRNSIIKIIGISVLAFGCGILLAFFLPTCVLVVLEAIVIISSGLLYLLQKR